MVHSAVSDRSALGYVVENAFHSSAVRKITLEDKHRLSISCHVRCSVWYFFSPDSLEQHSLFADTSERAKEALVAVERAFAFRGLPGCLARPDEIG